MDQRRRAGVFGSRLFLIPFAALLGALLLFLNWSPAQAQDASGVSPDAACRLCHVGSEETLVLPSGEEVPVGIDPAQLDSSVHGSHAAADVYCTDCHAPRQRYLYPHLPTDAQSLEEFRADVAQNCESCHISDELHNPGHLNADPAIDAPNCVECHGGHDVMPSDVMDAEPAAFCQSCHAIADMQDDQTRGAHENVTGNLAEDQSCPTCHSDQVQTVSQQCVNCHSLLDESVQRTGSEDPVTLHVDRSAILSSVHGDRVVQGTEFPPLECAECDVTMAEAGFPHPPELLTDREALRTRVEEQCADCHQLEGGLYADGIHAQHVVEGELNVASCASCHGSHRIHSPNEPRTRISDTCGSCHGTVYDQYKSSVHGAALYGRDNPDVPVCTDCHAAHDIPDPGAAEFRLSSPQMCGSCHADEEKMAKYDVSTNVFDSYVADFHGTTVTLFQHNSPNELTNKAVCYDCHGIHDIQSVSEATEQQIQDRLLVTCQKCHPDAGENFPASWMSHYEPSLERYPLVYLVNLFYTIFIPTIMGGFLMFIGSDVFRRVTDWWLKPRRRRTAPEPDRPAEQSTEVEDDE